MGATLALMSCACSEAEWVGTKESPLQYVGKLPRRLFQPYNMKWPNAWYRVKNFVPFLHIGQPHL